MVSHTPATRQSVVTQLMKIKSAVGVVSQSEHLHGVNLDKENVYEDDEDQWLHRNDSYQMQQNSRGKRNLLDTFGHEPQTILSIVRDRTQGNVIFPGLWRSK